jgi:hypothetical protein
MIDKVRKTLNDLEGINYLLTRFNKNAVSVDDLDILVRPNDFDRTITQLREKGYISSSHDQALGGRVPGAQINLTKPNRIKVDLHKDFTWRAKRYLDLDIVWSKEKFVDKFLVFINVLFEKTYIDREDYDYIWKDKDKIFFNPGFISQAQKYGWKNTFNKFKDWNPKKADLPIFLPLSIVFTSYIEKFHLISFMYYVFFRVRFLIKRKLPYD